MVRGFAILLLCQLAGEIAARALALPVPGPVIGLVLLVLGLALCERRVATADKDAMAEAAADVTHVADGLLANLALLFVPAGVGVVRYLGLLRTEALPLAAALVGSTAITLAATALIFVGVGRFVGARPRGDHA